MSHLNAIIAKSTGALFSAMLIGSVLTFAPNASAMDSDTTTTPTCTGGKIWDKKKKKCVEAEEESNLSDDNLLEAARDLAYHGRYDEAIAALKLAKNDRDPRILNYLGYATRKSGDVQKGLTYYQAALAIDPDYTLVREYMGEAYLQLGRPDKAREQLAEIEKRCGTTCQEYAMLKAKIDRFIR